MESEEFNKLSLEEIGKLLTSYSKAHNCYFIYIDKSITHEQLIEIKSIVENQDDPE